MTHRIIYFGSSAFGLPSLNALRHASNIELVAIVSQPAQPAGRQGELRTTDVADWADKHNLPLITPATWRTPEAVAELKSKNADTFIVAAYGLILPQSVLDIPSHGCLNIHASLLPKYRGASPINAAIVNNESTTGISFMAMDKGIDTGPVINQFTLDIKPEETSPQLQARLAELAAEHLPEVLTDWWNGSLSPQPQSGPSSYAPIMKTEDGQATWESAAVLERKIRAYQPWPGVWTMWRGQRLKLLSAHAMSERQTEQPGTIIPFQSPPGWAIVCQDGLLIPEQVQMAGKKVVKAETLPGGYPEWIGSNFD